MHADNFKKTINICQQLTLKKHQYQKIVDKNFNTYFLIINNDNTDEAYFCFEKTVKRVGITW